MSACRECGQDVTWARREEGGWHPPLSATGRALVVARGNLVRDVVTYEVHVCRPADVAEQTRRLAEHRREVEEQRAIRREVATSLAEQWALAEPRLCPRCGVEAGERCLNLSALKKGVRKETVWPHPERVPVPVRPDVEAVEPGLGEPS